MIHTHASNSAWWGQPVAIVTDALWFDQTASAQHDALARYVWAEFKAPLATAPSALGLCRAGFALADVQVNFRVGLRRVTDSPSLMGYECHTAAEKPFSLTIDDLREFGHERFLQLPGVTPLLLKQRYAIWANNIIATHPAWCLRLAHRGQTQGWFLAEFNGSSVHLVLAMLATDAVVSGQHLYHRALLEYARHGAHMGHAAFSIRNTPVLNIYAQLGAKFMPPTGCWLWVRPN